jgi:hypothetical protein
MHATTVRYVGRLCIVCHQFPSRGSVLKNTQVYNTHPAFPARQPPLDKDTAELAEGFDVVVAFVNDFVTAEVRHGSKGLHARGSGRDPHRPRMASRAGLWPGLHWAPVAARPGAPPSQLTTVQHPSHHATAGRATA